MGARGRKEKSNIKVLSPVNVQRPSPPKGMTAKARSIWFRIVNSYPVDYFKPQHFDLLRMYCGACVLQKESEAEIFKKGSIITQKNGVTKENPHVNIALKAESSATRLATKLGITVNNTTVNRGMKGISARPKSKREGLMYRG